MTWRQRSQSQSLSFSCPIAGDTQCAVVLVGKAPWLVLELCLLEARTPSPCGRGIPEANIHLPGSTGARRNCLGIWHYAMQNPTTMAL